MLKTLTLIIVMAAMAAAATVSGEMVFDRGQLTLNPMDGMTTVALGRCVSAWETGAPAVPIAVAQLVVPQDMKVIAVRLDAVEAETVPGTFEVYPVQPPQPVSNPGPFAFVPADPKYYGSVYPAAVVTAGHQGSMFGYNIASVFVAPVQYNGADKSLVLHSRVRFSIDLEPADLGCLHPGNRSPEARRRVEAAVSSIVINPQDVAACAPR
jgi:hypothetical protein